MPPARRVLVCGLVLGLLATGCVGARAVDQSAAGAQGYVAGTGQLSYVAPARRGAAPEVSGRLLDGRRFDLAALRGRVAVVNFWASWCAPCRSEAPALRQVATETADRGVAFLGVAIKDDVANAQAFQRRQRIGYPSLFDRDQRLALAFRDLPPTAVPTTIVLDRGGRPAARWSGPLSYHQLRELVERVRAEPV